MWEIQIISQTDDGYLVSAPNGDTQWLTKEEYQMYLQKRREIEQGNP